MRLLVWIPITILGVALAIAAGKLLAATFSAPDRSSRSAAPAFPLVVPEENLQAGDVWEAKDAVLTLSIQNVTDQDVEVLSFDKSCECLSVSPTNLIVPARRSVAVSIRLDLTERPTTAVGVVRRPFSVVIRPMIRGGARSPMWRVSCTAVSRATVNQLAIQFGELPSPRTATVTPHVPCSGVVCRADDESIRGEVRATAEGKYKVTVWPDPSRPKGAFRSTVRVLGTPDGESGPVELTSFQVFGEL